MGDWGLRGSIVVTLHLLYNGLHDVGKVVNPMIPIVLRTIDKTMRWHACTMWDHVQIIHNLQAHVQQVKTTHVIQTSGIN